jgi:hypothetical protein
MLLAEHRRPPVEHRADARRTALHADYLSGIAELLDSRQRRPVGPDVEHIAAGPPLPRGDTRLPGGSPKPPKAIVHCRGD